MTNEELRLLLRTEKLKKSLKEVEENYYPYFQNTREEDYAEYFNESEIKRIFRHADRTTLTSDNIIKRMENGEYYTKYNSEGVKRAYAIMLSQCFLYICIIGFLIS